MGSGRQRGWAVRVTALLAGGSLMAFGGAGCGSDEKDEPEKKDSAQKAKPKSPSASFGQPITLEGGGLRVRVIPTRVIEPVPAGEFDQPEAGKRFVGVQLILQNVGDKVYDDSPSNGAILLTGPNEKADTAILNEGPCSLKFGSNTKIAPGSRREGCVPFHVPRGAQPKTFEFSLDSPVGPKTGRWSVP